MTPLAVMREPSETDMQAVLVLAQQCTPDTRSLQVLDPLITVQELHAKLWVGSNGPQDQASFNISFPGTTAKAKWLSRQGSTRSKQSARSARSGVRSTTGTAAGRPLTNLSTTQQVPEYVNPMLWAAALQQEAMHGQPGAADPKLSTVLELQDSMLQQVQDYKQLAPQLEQHKLRHPYLRPVRKLPPGSIIPESSAASSTSIAAAAAAAQPMSQMPASPPSAARQPSQPSSQPIVATAAAAAPAVAVKALPLQQLASLTGRLEAACQQVIQDLPGLTDVGTPSTNPFADPATRRSQHHSRFRHHTHRSLAAKTPKTSRVQISSHNGSPRRHHQPTGSSAGSLRPPQLAVDLSASQAGVSSSTPGTCHTTQGFFDGTSGSTQQQQPQPQPQASEPPQQQQQQVQLQLTDYASVPFKLQHLRLEVQSPETSPRSRCSKGPKTARTPGKAQGSSVPPQSSLVALKAQLPPDAVDAFKIAAAATAEQQLQRYHARLQEAQQQLLARELGLDQQQQRQQQAQSKTGGSGSGNIGASSAAGGSTAAVAAGSAAPSAAELTMQQLVARLAQRDVRVDETATGDGQSADGGHKSHISAVNQRVAEASTLSELLDAANEHLRLAAQGSGFKLDIGRIARLHKMGKLWHSDASARSTASDSSSTGPSTVRSQGTARAQHQDSDSNDDDSSSSSSLMAASWVPRPVVPRPIPPGTGLQPAVAAAAAARASIMSATARGSTDSAHVGPEVRTAEQAAQLMLPGADRDPSSSAARRGSILGVQPTSSAEIAAAAATAAARRGSVLASQASCTTDVSATAASAAAAAARMSNCSMFSVGRSRGAPDSASSRLSADTGANARSSDSSRLPPPMKIPPPQLQPPSAAEVAVLPMPSLPQLLDLSHEPVKVLQARLERVWETLGILPEQQLDMVLKHTSRSAASQFESVLEVWETAAAAVLQREAILAQVLQIQSSLTEYRQQIHWHNSTQLQADAFSVVMDSAGQSNRTAAGLSQGYGAMLGLTVQQVRQVLWAFLAAEQQLQLAAQRLLEVTGEQLQVDCCAYPPADTQLSPAQLQALLHETWVATGSGSS